MDIYSTLHKNLLNVQLTATYENIEIAIKSKQMAS